MDKKTTLNEVIILTKKRNEDKVRMRKEKSYKKAKYALYNYLPKQQKDVIDCISPDDLMTLLEAKEYLMVARILGVLIDKKDKGLPLNKDQETVLKMPWVLYDVAVKNKKIW